MLLDTFDLDAPANLDGLHRFAIATYAAGRAEARYPAPDREGFDYARFRAFLHAFIQTPSDIPTEGEARAAAATANAPEVSP